ncbi:hypothetical protein L596_005154 [Steinernema carpocapsae]|uniref:Uncharacterized protein n=1 Tax=Steinernema carpocapsae TaxID=34508 RepID=A0A4U8UZK6_STECR|nr:hypothetical protein L596_005154 [Steinernema carpocapsae]
MDPLQWISVPRNGKRDFEIRRHGPRWISAGHRLPENENRPEQQCSERTREFTMCETPFKSKHRAVLDLMETSHLSKQEGII